MKRKQHALPGLFDTAEEAAVWLAVVKRDMKAHNNGKLVAPPKQDTPHKQRSSQLEARPLPVARTREPLSMPAQRPLAVARTHAWEWQAHACVASRLPRAEQA